MKRFVICDDDYLLADAVATMLRSIYDDQIHICILHSGEELIAFFSMQCKADVLLLDIELGEYSGIDLVRQYQPLNSFLQVIYISAHPNYCTDVYDTRHISFLTKPIQAAQLEKAVNAAFLTLLQIQASGIPLTSNGKITVVPAAQTLYIESKAHLLYVTTDECCLAVVGRLDAFLARLDTRFLRCHQSFAINMEKVKRLEGSGFLMENDVMIPISKLRRTAAKMRFMSYVEGIPWTQV